MKKHRLFLGLASIVGLAACGSDKRDTNPTPRTDAGNGDAGVSDSGPFDGASQSMMVGPAGGMIMVGQARVVVPAGALIQPTMLTVAEVNPAGLAPLPLGVEANGPTLAFLPHGATFSMPVTVDVPYAAADATNSLLNLDNDADTSWAPELGATFANGVATLSVTHFCDKRVVKAVTVERLCNNQLDDDRDERVDCLDNDCAEAPNCVGTPPTENCNNEADDDNDLMIDCADSDCASAPNCQVPPPENCTNGIDDDADLLIDCGDTDCSSAPNCQSLPPENCTNGVDDDGDGLIDCADYGGCCNVAPVCCELNPICIEFPLCSGG